MTFPTDDRFDGLPYGWIEGGDGVACVLVILDGDPSRTPVPERVGLLAQLALRKAQEAARAEPAWSDAAVARARTVPAWVCPVCETSYAVRPDAEEDDVHGCPGCGRVPGRELR